MKALWIDAIKGIRTPSDSSSEFQKLPMLCLVFSDLNNGFRKLQVVFSYCSFLSLTHCN